MDVSFFFFVEYVWPVYSRAGPVWDGVEVKVTARMMTWNNFGNGKRVSLNYIIVNRITATFNPYAPSQCNPSCFDGTQTKITQLNIIYVRWDANNTNVRYAPVPDVCDDMINTFVCRKVIWPARTKKKTKSRDHSWVINYRQELEQLLVIWYLFQYW